MEKHEFLFLNKSEIALNTNEKYRFNSLQKLNKKTNYNTETFSFDKLLKLIKMKFCPNILMHNFEVLYYLSCCGGTCEGAVNAVILPNSHCAGAHLVLEIESKNGHQHPSLK